MAFNWFALAVVVEGVAIGAVFGAAVIGLAVTLGVLIVLDVLFQ